MRKCGKLVVRGALGVTAVASLLALSVLTLVPRAVHGTALTVLTGSMTPGIQVGSVVIVRPVDPATLRVGDVVTYQVAPGRAEYITHRIRAIHTDTMPVTLTTKGDANRAEDLEPVPVTAVRGRVWFSVPYLGTVREAVSVGGGGLVLLVLGLFGYALVQIASTLRERRGAAASPTPAATDEPYDAAPGRRLQLLVATLLRSEFDEFSAEKAAWLLRADLVDEGPQTFTISLAREPEVLDAFVERLRPFSPVHLVRSEIVVVPPHTPPAPAAGAGILESGRPSHVTA